jgi:hypothetical protein
VDVGSESFLLGDTLIFKKDRYLGRLVASFARADSILLEFGKKTATKIETDAPFPSALRYFPDGLVPHSEKLTLSEASGGGSMGDLYSALYETTGGQVTLSFSVTTLNPIVEGVDRFLEGGSIIDYINESDYQAIYGKHPVKGLIFVVSRKGHLCVVSGFREKQVAKDLTDRLLENLFTESE